MNQISVDAAFKLAIQDAKSDAAILDESGKVLGWFIPAANMGDLQLEPLISAEEIKRRFESDEKRYTTAEVLAYLNSL